MTVENLMMPRYKVIADYPNRPLTMPIGHILTLDKYGAGKWWHEYTDNEPIHIDEGSTRFPAILRLLNWWEERSEEDLLSVKYAKTITGNSIRTVKGFELWWGKIILDGGKVRPISKWLPATSEQYNDYINSNSNAKP